VLGDCQKEEGRAGMFVLDTYLATRQQLYLKPSSRRWSNKSQSKVMPLTDAEGRMASRHESSIPHTEVLSPANEGNICK
jgi:hypothetical protein